MGMDGRAVCVSESLGRMFGAAHLGMERSEQRGPRLGISGRVKRAE